MTFQNIQTYVVDSFSRARRFYRSERHWLRCLYASCRYNSCGRCFKCAGCFPLFAMAMFNALGYEKGDTVPLWLMLSCGMAGVRVNREWYATRTARSGTTHGRTKDDCRINLLYLARLAHRSPQRTSVNQFTPNLLCGYVLRNRALLQIVINT